MDIKDKYAVWKAAVLGVGLDVDGGGSKECADTALSWGMACFPGIAWSVLFKPAPAASAMFDNANDTFFEKIVNNHADVNQLPQQGDIAVFAASPEAGYESTYKNPYGHVGVVDRADQQYVYLVQQDGSENQTITQLKARKWRYTRCIGWLRPRLTSDIPHSAVTTGPVNHPLIGKRLWVKPPVTQPWMGRSVYRRGQWPVTAHRIGALRPDWFSNGPNGQPGLVYPIEGVSAAPDTVSITTDTYGPVDIWVDKSIDVIY